MNYKEFDTDFLIKLRDTTEREYITLSNILEEKKDNLDYLNCLIKRICKHEWTTDNIDLMENYKLSQPIKFCSKCSLTNSA